MKLFNYLVCVKMTFDPDLFLGILPGSPGCLAVRVGRRAWDLKISLVHPLPPLDASLHPCMKMDDAINSYCLFSP